MPVRSGSTSRGSIRSSATGSNRGTDAELDWLVDGLMPDEEPAGIDLNKRLFGNFSTLARLGSATAPVSNWLANNDLSRQLLERFAGIDRRRELPQFERETLRDWMADRPPVADPEREVVLFPDLYTNHVQVERGKAAVRVLEAFDIHVRLADVSASGRAPPVTGDDLDGPETCRSGSGRTRAAGGSRP
jgi:hypothetical protein